MAFSLTSIKKAQKKRRRLPSEPPPGTYDPTIDATQRQNQRGYDDLLQDFAIGKQRGQSDLDIALGNLGTDKTNALEDLTTSRDRNLADLITGRTRAGEDHTAALGTLAHNYDVLANKQGQQARQAQVESKGILAQALAKRAANQARDQAPIDTAYARQMQDSALSESRLGEDFTRGTARTEQGATSQSDALKLAFDRAYGPGGENAVRISRAGRDLVAGNLDLSNMRWFQAAQMGYSPTIPKKKTKKQVIV